MATEIKAILEELKNIAQEQYTMRQKTKELAARKKELDARVFDYLETHEQVGLRLNNLMFMTSERKTHTRKKKAEIVDDAEAVLKRHGVQGNIKDLIVELDAARKGEPMSVPVLKMKQANMFQ